MASIRGTGRVWSTAVMHVAPGRRNVGLLARLTSGPRGVPAGTYQVYLRSVDRAGNVTKARLEVVVPKRATEPPPLDPPTSSKLIWPLAIPIDVSSKFGPRWGRMHQGIDISAPAGTPVRAVAAGRVSYAATASGYGNIVIVDHVGPMSTYYAHLSTMVVVEGDSVGQGEGLGLTGCTGHCLGPHLHFETRFTPTGATTTPFLDVPRDPELYLPKP
jgi:murein DD-endopeptidase MepM/ murein hydrolase activator NlpD